MGVTAQRNRALVALLVALTMTAAVLGAVTVTARIASAQAVHLEPRADAGADPFMPSLLEPGSEDPAVPETEAEAGGVETAGTGDQQTCDPDALTAYLDGHPQAAAAWVAALDADPTLAWSGGDGLTVEQIGAYIAELTPALLGGDVQVTNHRFVDGRSAAVQSVLQEGTAVLVDADGTPRVRCACGNPLAPAAEQDESTDGTSEYVGEPWDGFTYPDSDPDSDSGEDAEHHSADGSDDSGEHEGQANGGSDESDDGAGHHHRDVSRHDEHPRADHDVPPARPSVAGAITDPLAKILPAPGTSTGPAATSPATTSPATDATAGGSPTAGRSILEGGADLGDVLDPATTPSAPTGSAADPTTPAPPTTEAPATTKPVVTTAPVAEPDVTKAPVTKAPPTKAPVTKAPVTETPATTSAVTAPVASVVGKVVATVAATCPDGGRMPSAGCAVPAAGPPAGWVLRTATTMVPA